jgi:hypothetical protein
MKNVTSSLAFEKSGYTEAIKFPDQPAQNTKGTWKLDATKKNEEGAVDCVVFKKDSRFGCLFCF